MALSVPAKKFLEENHRQPKVPGGHGFSHGAKVARNSQAVNEAISYLLFDIQVVSYASLPEQLRKRLSETD